MMLLSYLLTFCVGWMFGTLVHALILDRLNRRRP